MASRNRPRASFIGKEDIADELHLWTSECEKSFRSDAKRLKSEALDPRITDLEAKVQAFDEAEEDPKALKAILPILEELETLQRTGVRYEEDFLKILEDEPDDVLKNFETLRSVRQAFESEPVKPSIGSKPRNVKRKLDTALASSSLGAHGSLGSDSLGSPAPQSEVSTPVLAVAPGIRGVSKGVSRSGSVAAPSVKSENGIEGEGLVKGVVQGKESKLVVGAEVLHRKKNSEGAGILCKITKILGEGKHRRQVTLAMDHNPYEIQDIDPEPDATPERVPIHSLTPIPPESAQPAEIPRGHQVLAVYPETTTFYKAEIVKLTKGGALYQLWFEGEDEEGTAQEVSRRYVLDVK